MSQDYPRRIIDVLDKKQWKRTGEIASALDTISLKVLPLLHFGATTVITYDGSGWKIKKKATPEDIEKFASMLTDDIKVEATELLRYQKPLRHAGQKNRGRQSSSMPIRGKGQGLDSIDEAMQQSTSVSQHGFSYGKKKSYSGPQGQYWTDPNFKKQEY